MNEKNKGGRPKRTNVIEPVNMKIDVEVWAKVKSLAGRTNRSMTSLVEEALTIHLPEIEKRINIASELANKTLEEKGCVPLTPDGSELL